MTATTSTMTNKTMTNDLGVWTADDCALVAIDYQREMFEVIRPAISADMVELNVRLLARAARAFGMPNVAEAEKKKGAAAREGQ